MDSLTIGKLAKLTGVNTETIRYYERRNLMPRPPSSSSGYRLYSMKDVSRLVFIRRCLRLGLILDEIYELMNAHLGEKKELHGQLDRTARAVEERKVDLEHLNEVIKQMSSDTGNNKLDIIDRLMHLQRWQESPEKAT